MTSMRGRPSSASGIGLDARRPGATPAPTPAGRRAGPGPRRRRRPGCAWRPCPTARGRPCRGSVPSSSRWRSSSASASLRPTSQLSSRREGLGVERVEVAAGRQHVGAAAGRRAARAGGHVAAVEAGEQVGRSRRSVWRRSGHQPVAHPARSVGEVVVGGARQPRRGGRLDQRRGTRPRSASSAVGSSQVEAELVGDRWPAATAIRAVGEPGDGQHQVDERVALGHGAEGVEPAADLGVLEAAQVAVDVDDHVVERRRSSGASSRPRSRSIGGLGQQRPRCARGAPAAWTGRGDWIWAYSSNSCSSRASSS